METFSRIQSSILDADNFGMKKSNLSTENSHTYFKIIVIQETIQQILILGRQENEKIQINNASI